MQCRKLSTIALVTSTLCAAMVFTACGTKGTYTPFYSSGQPYEQTPERASLVVQFDPANCVQNQPGYDFTIVREVPEREVGNNKFDIHLNDVQDGKFQIVSPNDVKLVASLNDGMIVHSGDPLIEKNVTSAAFEIKKTPKFEILAKDVMRPKVDYQLAITLFDQNQNRVGAFLQTLTDIGQSQIAQAEENPTSPSSVFEWIQSQIPNPARRR
jgi:hypothetical protein